MNLLLSLTEDLRGKVKRAHRAFGQAVDALAKRRARKSRRFHYA
jgi:hypothetical protein